MCPLAKVMRKLLKERNIKDLKVVYSKELPIKIEEDYNGKDLTWDNIFDLKQKFIEQNKNGEIDPRCKGCFNLVHRGWEEERYINYLHFNHWTHCNCDCTYCYTSWDKANFQKKKHEHN